jgi:predicted HTH transcriptional regulator
MTVLSKAQSSLPSIDVIVCVENTADLPFYRIEIPSGKNKPYCTAGGKYKIRGDGRNMSLDPQRLLALYLEVEGKRFFEHFGQRITQLEEILLKAVGDFMTKYKYNEDIYDPVRLSLDSSNIMENKKILKEIYTEQIRLRELLLSIKRDSD